MAGRLTILVGASCSGKTGLAKKGLILNPGLKFVRSRTTRPTRPHPFHEEDIGTYGEPFTHEEYGKMLAEDKLWSSVEYRGENYGLADEDFHDILRSGNGVIPLVPEVAERSYERYKNQFAVIIVVLMPTPSQFLANMRHRGITDPTKQAAILAEDEAIKRRAWRVPVTRITIERLDDYATIAGAIFDQRIED